MAPTAPGLRSNGGSGSAGAQWNRRNDSVELPDGKNRDLPSPARSLSRSKPCNRSLRETNQLCHLTLRQWRWGWQQGTIERADITNRPPSPPSNLPRRKLAYNTSRFLAKLVYQRHLPNVTRVHTHAQNPDISAMSRVERHVRIAPHFSIALRALQCART